MVRESFLFSVLLYVFLACTMEEEFEVHDVMIAFLDEGIAKVETFILEEGDNNFVAVLVVKGRLEGKDGFFAPVNKVKLGQNVVPANPLPDLEKYKSKVRWFFFQQLPSKVQVRSPDELRGAIRYKKVLIPYWGNATKVYGDFYPLLEPYVEYSEFKKLFGPGFGKLFLAASLEFYIPGKPVPVKVYNSRSLDSIFSAPEYPYKVEKKLKGRFGSKLSSFIGATYVADASMFKMDKLFIKFFANKLLFGCSLLLEDFFALQPYKVVDRTLGGSECVAVIDYSNWGYVVYDNGDRRVGKGDWFIGCSERIFISDFTNFFHRGQNFELYCLGGSDGN